MTETKPRAIIAHGHIFKNAGTTFDWTLKRNFKKGFTDHRDKKQMGLGGVNCLVNILRNNTKLKAVASHHFYHWMPLPDLPQVTIIPCFFIRHPIERVRSVYTFERRQKSDTPGAVHAKKLGFRDYVDWRMGHSGGGVVMNYQLKYCSGRRGLALDDDLLSQTTQFLSTEALTGVVDRYDESMVYFEHVLRERFPQIDLSYLRQNVSKGVVTGLSTEDKIAEICQELGDSADVLKECNLADLKLYSLINQALDRQLGQISNFSEKLEEFRLRCSKL